MKYEGAQLTRVSALPGTGGRQAFRFANRKGRFLSIFLLAWLGAWTLGGVSTISNLLSGEVRTQAILFETFWLLGWAAGWCLCVAQLLWMLTGSETLDASRTALANTWSIAAFNRTKHYQPAMISNMRWSDGLTWPVLIGNGRSRPSALEFTYGARTVRVLQGIDQGEAEALIPELSRALGLRTDPS